LLRGCRDGESCFLVLPDGLTGRFHADYIEDVMSFVKSHSVERDIALGLSDGG
jgi:hypothetical protein